MDESRFEQFTTVLRGKEKIRAGIHEKMNELLAEGEELNEFQDAEARLDICEKWLQHLDDEGRIDGPLAEGIREYMQEYLDVYEPVARKLVREQSGLDNENED